MAICWKEWHSGATRDTIIQQADFLAQKWIGIGQVLSSQNLLDLCPPLKKKFQLEANCFEIFCWFLATHQHDQPQAHICALPLEPRSHLPPHPAPLGWHKSPIFELPASYSRFPLAYLIYGSVHVSLLSICPTLCFPALSPQFCSLHLYLLRPPF